MSSEGLCDYKSPKGFVVPARILYVRSNYVNDEERYTSVPGDWEQTWGKRLTLITAGGLPCEYWEEDHEYGFSRPGGKRIEKSTTLWVATSLDLQSIGDGTSLTKADELLEQLYRTYRVR